MSITKGDIVFHKLSGLFFICENNQQARWMNMNPFYQWASKESVSGEYSVHVSAKSINTFRISSDLQ